MREHRWLQLERISAEIGGWRAKRRLSSFFTREIPQADLIAGINEKNIVFFVTSGRTGTKYIANLLSICKDTTITHEPWPAFEDALPAVRRDPNAARDFWLYYKLPAILGCPTRTYIETSNVFAKGFLEPLLALNVMPKLILLGRHPREIARSYLERNTVPGRTKLGLQFMLTPDDEGVLPLPGWRDLSDYQLCFWSSLEMERRQLRAFELMTASGGLALPVETREVRHYGVFRRLIEQIGLDDGRLEEADLTEAHAKASSRGHNRNPHQTPLPDNAQDDEEQVWQRVGEFETDLRSHVSARYEDDGIDYDSSFLQARIGSRS